MKNYVSMGANRNGSVELSKKVFENLGRHALTSCKEVMALTNKPGVSIEDGDVTVTIYKNRVYYKFDVEINKDADEEAIKNSIADIVTTNLLMLCESVPFEIETRVKRLK